VSLMREPKDRQQRSGTVLPKGSEIKRLRLLKGWGLEEFEAQSGVSRRNIQRLEAGEATRPDTLGLVAKALGQEYSSLIRTLGEPEPQSDLEIEISRDKIRIILNFPINKTPSAEQTRRVAAVRALLKELMPDKGDVALPFEGSGFAVFVVPFTLPNIITLIDLDIKAVRPSPPTDSQATNGGFARDFSTGEKRIKAGTPS
jgi:transcriptional regulator with XRE-family HTH domain